MKKNLLSAMVVLIGALLLVVTMNVSAKELTDEEKLIMYLAEDGFEDCDGTIEIVITDSEAMDGEGIEYLVYVDGELEQGRYTNRNYMEYVIR